MFKEINLNELNINPFDLIGNRWALVTAGEKDNFNTMTISWGFLGYLWERNVALILIRPTRYTFEFTEKYSHFTISFFEERYKEALKFLGTVSGRDRDKVKEAELTPIFEKEFTYFQEANLVLCCKKIYFQDIDNNHFLEPSIEKFYPKKDYHRMYIGEIKKVIKR